MAIDKIIDPGAAAKAYSNNAKTGSVKVAGDDGVSFSDFLKDKVGSSIDTMKQSETMTGKAVTGEADITDVVSAVTSAEVTLQTIVAVRDRLITAYQEIMRMPM